MNTNMVEEKVTSILNIYCSVGEFTMESKLVDDLGLDSLDILELTMYVEDDFAIEIPDSKVEEFKTVGDIVSYLKTRIN